MEGLADYWARQINRKLPFAWRSLIQRQVKAAEGEAEVLVGENAGIVVIACFDPGRSRAG